MRGLRPDLVHGLSRDLGPRGITINNVQPGPVDTDLNPAAGEFAEMLKKLMALPRYGHVDEIAAMVAYLAGPEAGFVTGASLTIDGGFTAFEDQLEEPMTTMRVAQVARPNGPFEIVERPIPEPGAGSVRIRVQACGICHSDSLIKEGGLPGIQYPRVPGHEVAGVLDAVGAGVAGWAPGQRVGVGWNGGYCGHCDPCRRGNFFACQTGQVTGVTFDGGYAEYLIAPASAVALVPESLPAVEAAPLMCAGITTFNALRNSGARPGDVVAVLGLGGLGHLAVQYAAKMGFHTVGIARGKDKEPLARQLGASAYIDSQAQDPAAELQKLGGAKVILATVTSGEAMSAVQGGLAVNGTLLVVGAAASMQVSPLWLLSGCRSVKGWYSGTSIDSQDTLAFSARAGVRSMNEIFPLEHVAEAYDRMMSGKARFRVVLAIGQ